MVPRDGGGGRKAYTHMAFELITQLEKRCKNRHRHWRHTTCHITLHRADSDICMFLGECKISVTFMQYAPAFHPPGLSWFCVSKILIFRFIGFFVLSCSCIINTIITITTVWCMIGLFTSVQGISAQYEMIQPEWKGLYWVFYGEDRMKEQRPAAQLLRPLEDESEDRAATGFCSGIELSSSGRKSLIYFKLLGSKSDLIFCLVSRNVCSREPWCNN